MNIKRAKQEIMDTLRAYLAKDQFGNYRIPTLRQRPLLLMGPPGIGKTQIMEQVATEMNLGLVAYTITHHTRQSALGLPLIRQETFGGKSYSVTEYTMSEILASVYRLIEQSGQTEGILFLDEINCISETLTPMMLQFLQYKTFGNQRLPEGWVLVAAGNPPEYNKSVREFDVATLDRVKRMDIQQDYGVWKEYALRKGLHGAILSYLDLRKDHFYAMEAAPGGMQFVTARGWEDLSELLTVYETLGQKADQEVVGQYLQLPRIAKDFAAYLEQYEKYRQVYQVDEILAGHIQGLSARELAAAPFDEKLSVLGLLLARLRESTRSLWQLDETTSQVHQALVRVKQAESNADAALLLQAELTALQQQISRRKQNGADGSALAPLLAAAQQLEGYLHQLELNRPQDAFAFLKEQFTQLTSQHSQLAEQTGQQLEYAFAFLEQALGESQEMVLFATELTAGFHTSWYIEQFGCPAYFRHNQSMLFDDTEQALRSQIAAARQQDSQHHTL